MTTKVDTLVDRYLKDLEAELRDLPANRRRELLDEVGEHITTARATLDAETEAAMRTILERLGDPADIAAEARERFGVQAEPTIPWLEVLTLAILVLVPFLTWLNTSVLVPFLGWLVGLVLLWRSHLWTTRDKRIGTLLALGVGALALLALASPLAWLGSLVMIVTLPTVIYLASRLRAHLAAMPATS
jgi:uncharacterized membrane protein